MITDNNQNFNRLSDILNIIKVPFFVLIVFIHNTNTTTVIPGIEIGPDTSVPLYYYISQYISEVLSRIAVPGFFLISGYLFFINTEFNRDNYCHKLKKRVKTLLVPYLFWNLLFMIYYFILPMFAPSFFQEGGHEMTLRNILCSLWVTRDGHAINQFWYVRDLMVCVVFSPLFYYLFSKFNVLRIASITSLFCLWFFGLEIPYIGPYGFSSDALFFFGLGSLLGMHAIIFTDYVKRTFVIIVALIFSLFDLLSGDGYMHLIYHHLFILFGLAAAFCIVGLLYEKGHTGHSKAMIFISSASFFVYAVHLPWIIIPLRKVLFSLLNPTSALSLLLIYFIVVIGSVLLSLLLYSIMAKFFPVFTSVITGGRLNKK